MARESKDARSRKETKEAKPTPHWFILETEPGAAAQVAEALRNALPRLGLVGAVLEIRCPTQELPPPAEGATPIPGFFLARMCWNATIWGKLRAFEGVTGFLGEHNVPVPVTDTELAFVTRQMSRPRRTKTVVRFSGDGSED
jgi:transcription antitermination factor NusG